MYGRMLELDGRAGQYRCGRCYGVNLRNTVLKVQTYVDNVSLLLGLGVESVIIHLSVVVAVLDSDDTILLVIKYDRLTRHVECRCLHG